jgi:hypothetical protein
MEKPIQNETCNDAELPKVEAALRARGYRPVNKTNEKDLLPGEYIKSSFTGSEQSFEGPKMWTVRWRIK